MTSIGSPSPFFLAGKKAYEVERSLRFNRADNAGLTRSPSSTTNSTKQTLSFWFKISSLNNATNQGNFFAGGSNGSWNYVQLWSDTFYFGNSAGPYWNGNLALRDFSAWYHAVIVIDTTQSTANDRQKLYINGVQQERGGGSNPSQDSNYEFLTNSTWTYYIGKRATNDHNFDGYMAEINFVQGLALDASYFGETDAITGQWNPKRYGGSYGTNGFYLNFSENSGTTATTLGKDFSGNGNNWTPSNFSVAANLLNDSMPDTPTNNFCTLNPLNATSSFNFNAGEGNLVFDQSSNDQAITGTFFIKSGKWYWEIYKNSGQNPEIGICGQETLSNRSDGIINSRLAFITNGGNLRTGSSSTTSITGSSSGQTGAGWIRIAVDMDNKKIWFSDTSGNYFNSGNPATGANAAYDFSSHDVANGWVPYVFMGTGSGHNCYMNFGQFDLNSFSSNIPAGFKTLCSANLPDPTIKLPNKHFDTLLYTGNNGTQNITGLNFNPDWVWAKNRQDAGYHHDLYDTVRGDNLRIFSSQTNGEQTGYLQFGVSGGFTLTAGGGINTNGSNHVAWNWNGGDTDGKTYIVKVHDFSGNNRYIFDDFQTQAVTLDLAEGGTYIFNMDDASNASHPFSIGTAANGTVYTSGITYFLDGVSKTYSQYTSGFAAATTRRLHITVPASAPVLYYWCSAHSGMGGQINTNSTLGSSNFDGSTQSTVKVNQTAGFSIVRYTGNGSTATIGHGLGAAPQTYIVKETNSTADWYVYHKEIGATRQLKLNTNDGRANNDRWQDTHPTSSVFYLAQKTASNGSGDTYIAYCFSEVTGYSKFGSYTGNGNANGSFVYTGFRPAWIMLKRSDTDNNWHIADNKRQNPYNVVTAQIYPNLANAEVAQSDLDIVSNGFKIRRSANFHNANGGTYIYLAFAESPFKNARAR